MRVGVEAGAGADAAAARAAVAEMHGDAVVGMAGDREQRAAHRAAAELQLDDVGDDLPCSPPWNDGALAAFSFAAVAGLTSTALSQVSLRDRLRQFLQPAVVGEAAVEDATGRCGTRSRGAGRRRRRAAGGASCRLDVAATPNGLRRERGVRDHAVVQPAAPRASSSLVDLPVLADDVVGRSAPGGRSSPRAVRAPTCRRRAARSAAGRSTPCRRRRARRSTLRGSALPESASGTAPTSHRRTG